jgi:hypothetical protein
MTTDEDVAAIRTGLAHPFIRERTAAIERCRALLQAGQGGEALLSLLKRTAAEDPFLNVREAAQQVLDQWQRAQWAAIPGAPANPEEHFPLRCPRCGHVTWFNKRRVCGQDGSIQRSWREHNGRRVARLTLRCEQQSCRQEMVREIDCEGYR